MLAKMLMERFGISPVKDFQQYAQPNQKVESNYGYVNAGTRNPNQDHYIHGMTAQSPEVQTRLQNAIRKYGSLDLAYQAAMNNLSDPTLSNIDQRLVKEDVYLGRRLVKPIGSLQSAYGMGGLSQTLDGAQGDMKADEYYRLLGFNTRGYE